jgi:hypothetical protein
MINWYHNKRREYPCHSMMQAEYPTDDTEAFANTGHNIFPNDHVERLRQLCRPPALVGELAGLSPVGQGAITSIRFSPSSTGLLKIWETPRPGADRYVTAVDIGGRSAASDYSVIAVFDRLGPKPAVVAQWRGHLDHDLLTWKAATIAAWYNNALLVIESNTLETENTEGDNSLYILSRLRRHYSNLYIRGAESEFESTSRRIGFHTNRATKSLIINDLIARVRDGQYIERDNDACDELAVYQLRPDGSTGAREGCHDDILMTRAIALYVIRDARPPLDIDDLRRYLRNTRLTYLTAPARDTAPRPSIP